MFFQLHDENIFTNSFGHSVPRINGKLQSAGKEFCGRIVFFESDKLEKRIVIEFRKAYAVPNLKSLRRTLLVNKKGILLEDFFVFSHIPKGVEETFVTYLPIKHSGSTLRILGKKNILELKIEKPKGLSFSIEVLKKESQENDKPVPLKRLTFAIKAELQELKVYVSMKIIPRVK